MGKPLVGRPFWNKSPPFLFSPLLGKRRRRQKRRKGRRVIKPSFFSLLVSGAHFALKEGERRGGWGSPNPRNEHNNLQQHLVLYLFIRRIPRNHHKKAEMPHDPSFSFIQGREKFCRVARRSNSLFFPDLFLFSGNGRMGGKEKSTFPFWRLGDEMEGWCWGVALTLNW